MKENKSKGNLPTKFSLAIRIAVGLYLFYTVYSLRGVTKNYSGAELAFFIIAMVVFTVIGALLCFFSARALMTGRFADGTEEASEKENGLQDISDKQEEVMLPGQTEAVLPEQEVTDDKTDANEFLTGSGGAEK